MEVKADPLNILFVQNSPCIRNYKMANALRSRGHSVSLAYSEKLLSQMYVGLSDSTYNECIRLNNYRHLWDISKNYDLIHCHNEPDTLSVAAFAGNTPVIHDTHDLISLRDQSNPNLSYFEGLANRGATGRVYSTPYQMEEAKQLYGVDGPSLVFYNYVSESDLPHKLLPKLSHRDGKTHVVYEGGIGGNRHRDFLSLLIEIASQDIQVHIYPNTYNQKIADYFLGHRNIYYCHPLSPKQIIENMSQFDFGIIPFVMDKGNRRFLNSTIANKLFEYLAARLPVATSALQSYHDFFNRYPVGTTFSDVSDLICKIPLLKDISVNYDFSQVVMTYEKEIGDLITFYYRLIKSTQRLHDSNLSLSIPESSFPKKLFPQTSEKILILKACLKNVILGLDNWLSRNGWAGYDPYDVRAYLLHHRVAGSVSQLQIDHIMNMEENCSEELRRKLGIEPQINAKAIALFLNSYAQLSRLIRGRTFGCKIASCYDWLLKNSAGDMQGLGWGYPFDWESVVIIPAGTPTSVNSYHAGDAFWELYRLEAKAQWLDLCVKVAEFFVNDLNRDEVDPSRICFSYTPLDFFHVHNANLCVAEFLIRIGKEIRRQEFITLGEKAVQFALSDFSEDGFLTYWANGYEPSQSNKGQIDHYHTAAELRSLFRLTALLPERIDIKTVFERYFDYYLDNFFKENKIPKIHPKQVYPINIHAAAEAAYILGETALQYPKALNIFNEFLPWFIDNCRNEDGSFIYMISYKNGSTHVNQFPFIRWGQAWTLRGLTSAYTALTSLTNEPPSDLLPETENCLH